MGPKAMGPWFVGKITLGRKLGMFMTQRLPFDPPAADQHSTIPLFQVRGRQVNLEKIPLLSICCRIFETLN